MLRKSESTVKGKRLLFLLHNLDVLIRFILLSVLFALSNAEFWLKQNDSPPPLQALDTLEKYSISKVPAGQSIYLDIHSWEVHLLIRNTSCTRR